MYHVTHETNGQSIAAEGVSPDYSQGKMNAIWFVPKQAIERAILHCAARHHWLVEDLLVVTMVVPVDNIRYSGNGYFFYSRHAEKAETIESALKFITSEDE